MNKKTHPIRGAIGGLCFGLGLMLMLLVYGKPIFGNATLWIPIVFFIVVGVVLGIFGPSWRRQRY
jgi:uncharacterized membrane protein